MSSIASELYISSNKALHSEGKKCPLVTIVIPVFNGSNFVERAISSAISQRNHYPFIEIIVVNDGSTDNGVTREIALSFGAEIIYLEKPNGGVASALNCGIQRMSGELFSWLSHDDFFHEDRFVNLREILPKLTPTTILSHEITLTDCSGKPIRAETLLSYRITGYPYINLIGCLLCGCALVIPKGLILAAGGFREDLRCVQDWDMWSKISLNAEIVHVALPLTSVSIHTDQVTARFSQQMNAEEALILPMIIAKYLDSKHRWIEATRKLKFGFPSLLAAYLYHYYRRVKQNSAGACAIQDCYLTAFGNGLSPYLTSNLSGTFALAYHYVKRSVEIFSSGGISTFFGSFRIWINRQSLFPLRK